MTGFNRRKFLASLSLGAGASLLNPIAETLISEAQGQTPRRKLFVIFMTGNGIRATNVFTPKDQVPGDANSWSTIAPTKNYQWPAMMQALAPYRDRMLLIDGLTNEIGLSQHSAGYGALSGFNAAGGASSEYGGPPGGVTIDQFIANKIGQNTRLKSLLCGAGRYYSKRAANVVFAAGPQKPVPFFINPQALFDYVYGPIVTDASGKSLVATRQHVVLDSVRTDIKKLQANLATYEKTKLDDYLKAVDDFEKRMQIAVDPSCKMPPSPLALGDTTPVEDIIDNVAAQATLALQCGMTNVVGIALGVGMSHQTYPDFRRLAKGTQWEAEGAIPGYGHDENDTQALADSIVNNYSATVLKTMADSLSAIKVGDHTLFDDTVMLYMSDNAEAHHAGHKRWPLYVLGNAGGALKVDGSYRRYPTKGSPGYRSMMDFFCSIATAVGAPTTDFGKGGVETVTGPLEDLMA